MRPACSMSCVLGQYTTDIYDAQCFCARFPHSLNFCQARHLFRIHLGPNPRPVIANKPVEASETAMIIVPFIPGPRSTSRSCSFATPDRRPTILAAVVPPYTRLPSDGAANQVPRLTKAETAALLSQPRPVVRAIKRNGQPKIGGGNPVNFRSPYGTPPVVLKTPVEMAPAEGPRRPQAPSHGPEHARLLEALTHSSLGVSLAD